MLQNITGKTKNHMMTMNGCLLFISLANLLIGVTVHVNNTGGSMWQISEDNMSIVNEKGERVYRTGEPSKWASDTCSQEQIEDAVRHLYRTESLSLIKVYMEKHSLNSVQISKLINEEIELLNAENKVEESYQDVVMKITNEGEIKKLTGKEVDEILNETSPCFPWVGSFLRSSIYKWVRCNNV